MGDRGTGQEMTTGLCISESNAGTQPLNSDPLFSGH